VEVRIISAEFGLIPADEMIPAYERRLTTSRADELRPQVVARLRRLLRAAASDEVFIVASTVYRQTLVGFEKALQEGSTVAVTAGAPGRQLAQLRA
jgi:hypothetical protein